MTRTITADLVEAYSLCPRKAFLLMVGESNPGPHNYEQVVKEQAEANRQAHRVRLEEAREVVPFDGPADLAAGKGVLADADLSASDLHARCDFLVKVADPSRVGRHGYEPVMAVGTCRPSKADGVALVYRGLVLGEAQGRLPASGTLVLLGNRPCKVKLGGKYKEVRRIVETLRVWVEAPTADAPPVMLNKHCPTCPFHNTCRQQAEREDSLSLLDRMTPRLMKKYHEKGIFTIKQLSHVYKPRRSRKKAKRQVRHSLELQALAIRTGKVHVEHLPELPRGNCTWTSKASPIGTSITWPGSSYAGVARRSTNPSGLTTRQARRRSGRPWSSGWKRSPTPQSTTMAATRGRRSPHWRSGMAKGRI